MDFGQIEVSTLASDASDPGQNFVEADPTLRSSSLIQEACGKRPLTHLLSCPSSQALPGKAENTSGSAPTAMGAHGTSL